MPERRLFHPFRPFSRLTLLGPLSDFVPDVQSLLAPSAQAADIAAFGGSGGGGGGGQGATPQSFGGTLTHTAGSLGGRGGSSSLTLNDMNAAGDVYVSGGQGGGSIQADSVGSGNAGTGGMGGDAALSAGTLTVAGTLNVYSGGRDTTCATNPGTGGYASFTATTLAASSIHLSKNNGNLAFNVTTLDVASGDTLILLADTAATTSAPGAGDNGVYIGTAKWNAAIVTQSLSEKRTPQGNRMNASIAGYSFASIPVFSFLRPANAAGIVGK